MCEFTGGQTCLRDANVCWDFCTSNRLMNSWRFEYEHIPSTRLETRTQQSNICANSRVGKPKACEDTNVSKGVKQSFKNMRIMVMC